MAILQLILIPLIGAFIGWITNLIAVKMLFRPYQPWAVLGFQIQGLIPKRQGELAKVVGQVVQNELLNTQEIMAILRNQEMINELQNRAMEAIQFKVMAKVPKFIPMSLRAALADVIKEVIKKETPELMDELFEGLEGQLQHKLDLAGIVERKINEMNLLELEELILSIASTELKHIEYLGAVLGLLIGILQALLTLLT